jgi:hypothetical protein
MSSLSPKDRVSLCSFTFSDGRRCRSPRFANHPRFCPYHAQKEARARVADNLGKDLARYFSGDYISACDLSTALGCLIPAVVRGDIKSKTARTVAYMAQTLLQSIHISQHEYINAFGTDGWRKSIRNSVNGNHNYRFPPAPEPDSAPEPEQSESPQPQPAQPQTQPQQPAPSSRTPMPPTSTEFVQHVMAGLQTGGGQATQPAPAQTRSPIPRQAPPTPSPTPAPAPSPTSIRASQTPASPPNPNHPASTTDKPQPPRATQSAPPSGPTSQPVNPTAPRPSTGPSRDTPWWNFGHTGNIPPDSHLL